MDEKFYLVNENLRCPDCNSDKVVLLGGNNDIGYAVKCQKCEKIFMEDELEEKNGRENYDNLSRT